MKSIPLCTVKGCPAPNDPDWHIPWCQDIPGHECFGGATHQHVPKRSQGGKKIVACLCAGAHDRIDNGTDWGNSVVPKEDGKLAYWAFDLHGNTLIERTLKEESDGEQASSRLRDDSVHGLDDRRHGRDAPTTGDGSLRADAVHAGASIVRGADSDSGADSAGDSPHLTHEQRLAIAQQIHDTEWNRQWIAGDTGNQWIAELGEEAEQYLSDFGYVHESLANILRVCAAIPPPYRNGNLRFSHHVVVSKENREDMEMWLGECDVQGWSVAEFRRHVKGTKPKVKRWNLEELLARHSEWHDYDSEHGGHGTAPTNCLRCTYLLNWLDWLGEQP